MTLRQARGEFFAAAGFAPDGGYDEPWAEASFGPFPYAVPNTAARARALRVHDLHHVLTGHATDWRSESRISAWELGSGGGGRYLYAWFIVLFGLLVGLLALPRDTWRAYRRGRGSRNLYRETDPLARLEQPVTRVRQQLGLRRGLPRATLGDRARFGLWAALALTLAVGFTLGSPLLVGLALLRRLAAGLRRLAARLRCLAAGYPCPLRLCAPLTTSSTR